MLKTCENDDQPRVLWQDNPNQSHVFLISKNQISASLDWACDYQF